jgi:uncharacterized DUF497 family protein
VNTFRIDGFIWLEEIVEKIARKHGINVSEAEEVFQNTPKFRFIEKGYRESEDVYAALGRTDAGRYVIVFFVYKRDGRALPVSARDMSSSERRMYGQK